MLSGTYSSIFIATPVLADLKEREPQYRDLAVKVKRRLAGGRASQRAGGDTAGTTSTSATAAAAAAVPAEADDDLTDMDSDAAEVTEQDGGVAVPAAASRSADAAPRPVVRQQRVTGSAQRRPGAKKKRR
jgi:preprotein translocase subunit SecF